MPTHEGCTHWGAQPEPLIGLQPSAASRLFSLHNSPQLNFGVHQQPEPKEPGKLQRKQANCIVNRTQTKVSSSAATNMASFTVAQRAGSVRPQFTSAAAAVCARPAVRQQQQLLSVQLQAAAQVRAFCDAGRGSSNSSSIFLIVCVATQSRGGVQFVETGCSRGVVVAR